MAVFIFALGVGFIVIMIIKQIMTPPEKVTAKVVRKGEMYNTEKRNWINPDRNSGTININLNWLVVFQEIDTDKQIELEVSGSKYDELKEGQIYKLYHKNGYLEKFEVESD